jgi:hypothetical protein
MLREQHNSKLLAIQSWQTLLHHSLEPDAMSDRICYHVYMTNAGWSARFDGFGSLQQFVSRERAVDAARDAAKTRWEVLGKPSCVTIKEMDGDVVTDSEFGD